MNPEFTNYEADDVLRLIKQYPLAWLISPAAAINTPSLLPLIGEYDSNGNLTTLIGHMAKSNPLNKLFEGAPEAQILFTGPQGYISPQHAGLRDWAPTWNYAALRIDVQIVMCTETTEHALKLLIEQCEEEFRPPWSPSELGERYEKLSRHIIGFRANVQKIHGTFKLGQDENKTVLNNIINSHPDSALRVWLQNFDRGV